MSRELVCVEMLKVLREAGAADSFWVNTEAELLLVWDMALEGKPFEEIFLRVMLLESPSTIGESPNGDKG
jgi:hypothetical protein